MSEAAERRADLAAIAADRAAARARRAAAAEGLTGVLLVAVAAAGFDWRAGLAVAGALLYITSVWGRI